MGFSARDVGRLAIASVCALLCACAADAPDGTPMRLGEATEANIAATAARPSDLAAPRKVQPRDTARRDAVMASYRADGGQIKTDSVPTVPTVQAGQRK